jgi:anthranilate synthase component 1
MLFARPTLILVFDGLSDELFCIAPLWADGTEPDRAVELAGERIDEALRKLAPAKDALDALFAGFPAGTVSGAPKVRACQIIAELEPETRGPYAGGVGYFAPDGSVDSCIVLRTAVVKDGVMHVQAGAGIVADSDPAYEQRECEAKAGALIAAAREAARVAGEPGFGQ